MGGKSDCKMIFTVPFVATTRIDTLNTLLLINFFLSIEWPESVKRAWPMVTCARKLILTPPVADSHSWRWWARARWRGSPCRTTHLRGLRRSRWRRCLRSNPGSHFQVISQLKLCICRVTIQQLIESCSLTYIKISKHALAVLAIKQLICNCCCQCSAAFSI